MGDVEKYFLLHSLLREPYVCPVLHATLKNSVFHVTDLANLCDVHPASPQAYSVTFVPYFHQGSPVQIERAGQCNLRLLDGVGEFSLADVDLQDAKRILTNVEGLRDTHALLGGGYDCSALDGKF